jgi:hypothetical protein
LGELLIDGELLLDQGLVRWASIILFVLFLCFFGLTVSVQVLLHPIKDKLLWLAFSANLNGGS